MLSIDKVALEKHFAPHGAIESCIVVRDRSGVCRGFGFVCYSTPVEATQAIDRLNGSFIGPNSKPIFVAMAQRKEERLRMIQAQRNR